MWPSCFFTSFFNRIFPDKDKTQIIYDKAVDDYLAALKLIPYCPVISKVIKKTLYCVVRTRWFTLFDEYSADVTFGCDEMGILNVNLGNINLDNNFDEDEPDTIIHIRHLVLHSRFKKRKALKKRD